MNCYWIVEVKFGGIILIIGNRKGVRVIENPNTREPLEEGEKCDFCSAEQRWHSERSLLRDSFSGVIESYGGRCLFHTQNPVS